jgi:mannose-6-phosphate isomerase-like protein (cupin superfamily)
LSRDFRLLRVYLPLQHQADANASAWNIAAANRRSIEMVRALLVSTAFVTTLFASPLGALAETQPITRTPLQTFDVPGTNYQTVIGIALIIPNVNAGRHTHPGPESGYVLEGEMVLIVEGQPDKTVKTGESYQIAPGVVHDVKTGAQGVKVIATYVVEKGKPLASPAP